MAQELVGQVTGYAHPLYAQSLSEFGEIISLPRSGGCLLARAIPDTAYRDAMWPYPLFACRNWAGLADDLAALENLVSVVAVVPPFLNADLSAFGFARRYKSHFFVDTHDVRICKHHRRNIRKAQKQMTVEVVKPFEYLDDWCLLYSHLKISHHISGIAAFSRHSFETQLRVPGIFSVRAVRGGETVGMLLWYIMGEVAFYHLGASSASGYAVGASFAMFDAALEALRGQAHWLVLGGAAGLTDDTGNGLARFKHGWATGSAPSYLCGSILDVAAYAELCGYFPAYRGSDLSRYT
jgi:hypothetical protein